HQAKDFDDVVNSIAILKYYNVFNGSDIEEIDFKLDELQLGRVVKSDESLANEKNEIAELIVTNYPKPAPTIKHGGNKAYHQEANDLVQMPRFQSFDTPNDYYRTLFHELTHSTGNKKRLARKLGNKFGSKEYAKEELIAEFGAVFLSAQAGIIWHTNKNHAEYLKGWSGMLKIAKEDNKFLMRGASAAQKASDFVLNLDANNVPAFHKELGKIVTTKKSASIPDMESTLKKNQKSKRDLKRANSGIKIILDKWIPVDEKIKEFEILANKIKNKSFISLVSELKKEKRFNEMDFLDKFGEIYNKGLRDVMEAERQIREATKKTASIPDSSAYPVAVNETPKTVKENAPFDSCGRLRKGWHYKNGKLTQVASKVKATKKAEIKKVVEPKPTKKDTDTLITFKNGGLAFSSVKLDKIQFYFPKTTPVKLARLFAIKKYGWKKTAGIWETTVSELYRDAMDIINEYTNKNQVKYQKLTANDITEFIVKDAVKKKAKTSPKDELFSKEDIPYQLAYDAHRGTSFDPEKRAVSHQNEYYNTLKDTYEVNYKKAIKLSVEDDFEAKFIRFKNGYLNRYLAYLRSKNGMMSTMITGASNFPVARMRKKSDAIDKKLNELVEFVDKYDNFFKAKAPSKIKTGSADALEKLNKKLIDLEEQHSLMKKGNAVINKVLRKKGLSRDAQIKEITIGFEDFFKQKTIEAWVKLTKDGSSIKSNNFYLTNLTANIRELKKQIVLEKRLKESSDEKGNTEIEFENGTIIINREINKFQILFDGKPDADVRAFLKKAGHAFKWSPTNGVWQRQLNTYYRGNIEDLYAFLGVEVNNPPKKKATKKVVEPAVKNSFYGRFDKLMILRNDYTDKIQLYFTETIPVELAELFKIKKYGWKKTDVIWETSISKIDTDLYASTILNKYVQIGKENSRVTPVQDIREFIGKLDTYALEQKKKKIERKIYYAKDDLKELIRLFPESLDYREKQKSVIKKQEALLEDCKEEIRLEESKYKTVMKPTIKEVEKDIFEINATTLSKFIKEGRYSSIFKKRIEEELKKGKLKLIDTPVDGSSLSGNSLASKLANRQNKVAEFYKIQDENISEFLGKIEVKQKESVVITLTGGQGSMKTRCAFRFINAFAQNYKVGHAS
ncbi:zincin-like metallopeptidase domain-containing protein, partial [Tenacibaculum piscium]|uniref:zincin-like metallopeptidase domain-containing protein n=1 Tax=Tenacibaculum piscium TaxID=1458515 RepID=UPI0021D40B08